MKVKARSLLCLLAAGLILAWPSGASAPRVSTLLANIEVNLPPSRQPNNPAIEKAVILELSPDPIEEAILKIGNNSAKSYWENRISPRRWKLAVYEKRPDGQKVVAFVKKRGLFKRHFGPYLLDEKSFNLLADYFDISHQQHHRYQL